MKTITVNYDNLSLKITKKDALKCSHSGNCFEDIKELMKKKYIKMQFACIKYSDIMNQLIQFGFDMEDKKNTELTETILWIACSDIVLGNY